MAIGAFAERVNVTRQAVEKAIRSGRLPAYDANGEALAPTSKGRKFLKGPEALAAWSMSRARVDDAALAEIDEGLAFVVADRPNSVGARSLTQLKADREKLQVEYLRQRMARERGELVSREAIADAFETAGREVARKVDSVMTWAEEIAGAAMSGGAGAVVCILRQKVAALKIEIADALSADSALEVPEDDGEALSEDATR